MSRKIGNLGENRAVSVLFDDGYKIIERNYQTRFGEIDIIAYDKAVLVFVEVKQRKNDYFGSPAEFINKQKVNKILKAAKEYLYENNLLEIEWRIDAVTINEEKSDIEIYKNIYIEGIN